MSLKHLVSTVAIKNMSVASMAFVLTIFPLNTILYQVMCLGDGAGANILLRFGMHHPTRVHGVVAVNTDGIETASFYEILVRFSSLS